MAERYELPNVEGMVLCESDASLAEAGRVWPLTFRLAQYIVESTSDTRNVIELGAGTGVLSCLLARAFPLSAFTATDLPHVIELIKRNVALNGLQDRVAVSPLRWGDPLPPVSEPFTTVLLCECLYWGGCSLLEEDTRLPLRRTLKALLDGGQATCYAAFSIRDAERELGLLRSLELDGLSVSDTGTGAPWQSAVEGNEVLVCLRRAVSLPDQRLIVDMRQAGRPPGAAA
jgi:Lysine methyltransferase